MLKGGRPKTIAVLPQENLSVDIRRRFYDAIDSMSYIEHVALARALHMHPYTVITTWKTRKRFPNILTALRVIKWNEMGRPVTTEKQQVSFIDMA